MICTLDTPPAYMISQLRCAADLLTKLSIFIRPQDATVGRDQNFCISSKLIDGSFPDYEKVIPQNNDKNFKVDNKPFYEAVDRVSTVSSEKSKSIKLSIFENLVSLSSNSVETGSGAEDIEVEYSGNKIEIGYNAKYLLEIISQITGDKIIFELSDPSSPSIIKDTNDKNTLYILMPMRV